MGKRFVTIFKDCANIHLIKDVGMIPFYLFKISHFKSELVTYRNGSDYSFLKTEVPGLKLSFLPFRLNLFFLEPAVLIYILFNSRKIDYLNLYHIKTETAVYGILYKILNPNGFLYVKADSELSDFQNNNQFFPASYSQIQKIKNWIEKQFLKFVDLISIENTFSAEFLKKKRPEFASKISYLPNGIHVPENILNTTVNFDSKEDLIITVGRIGHFEKNSELLLDAVTRLNLKDWKVVFIGPIDPGFKEKMEAFYSHHPNLSDRVIFLGPLMDRAILYQWYQKAKVFCLTSPKESFGIVLVEALFFGNYLITTAIAAANDITEEESLGKIVPVDSSEMLAQAIQNVIDLPETLRIKNDQIINAGKKYLWSSLILNLSERLERK